MPLMTVSPLSASTSHRKVGSSLVKRPSALTMLICEAEVLGLTVSLMTGSGTCMLVMLARSSGAAKVSPLAQSTPKSTTMSPAVALVMWPLS